MCLLSSIMNKTILEIEFLTIDLRRVDFIFSTMFQSISNLKLEKHPIDLLVLDKKRNLMEMLCLCSHSHFS